MARRYWIETLGCPKNEVDSDKLAGTLTREGFAAADSPERADLVVVNTCAFVEAARQESIETVLSLHAARRSGSRLVVTGCMAERYHRELEAALPEVELVAPFGVSLTGATAAPPTSNVAARAPTRVPVVLGRTTSPQPRRAGSRPAGRPPNSPDASADRRRGGMPGGLDFDLLELERPASSSPWAYVKVAEGCDRHCGFCAIPTFRGRQRSRSLSSVLAEIAALASGGALREVVLVAQDLASFGLDRWPARGAGAAGSSSPGPGGGQRPETRRRTRSGGRPVVELVRAVADQVDWVRLLYLFPSRLDDELVEAILSTGVAYFDLSLQHVSRPLLARMRRPGDGERFLERIGSIRSAAPGAAFRSSFIVGYPGETEADHDLLLEWLEEAQLDWVGFFPYSREEGTKAADLPGQVPPELVTERLLECSELQDRVTAGRRDALIGEVLQVLVVGPGEARSYREAPEVDGIVHVPADLRVGSFAEVLVTGAAGPDLDAVPAGGGRGPAGHVPANESGTRTVGACHSERPARPWPRATPPSVMTVAAQLP